MNALLSAWFVLSLGLWLVAAPSQRASAQPGFRLLNVTTPAGIRFHHDNAASPDLFLIETMGAGCAWLDYDGDGWLDLFFVQSAATQSYKPPLPLRNALYRNRGDGTFGDVTDQCGLGGQTITFGMGAAVGDVDNDGDPDLYVTGFDRSVLYRNDGGRFVDITNAAGVQNAGQWGASAAFLDYDRDGALDLVVVNYLDWDYKRNIYCGDPRPGYRTYCHPNQFPGVPPTLYRNKGDGTFVDATRASGLFTAEGKGLGVAAADYNGDGWTDLFQANDSVRNFLFRNNKDGTFTECGLEAGVAYGDTGKAEAGMGIDFGDYDRDGFLDVYVTHLDMELHRLFRNLGDGVFIDQTYPSGLASRANLLSGFGTRFVDLNCEEIVCPPPGLSHNSTVSSRKGLASSGEAVVTKIWITSERMEI